MAVFFTSDTHFGHEPVIRFCKRPFSSIEEMDEAMIARWNERIRPNDTVYHLGDFCFRNTRSLSDYARKLNGEIHLIIGNHDTLSDEESALFASTSLIREIKLNKVRIVLCHYPMREWNRCWRGSWHLFGHVHGRYGDDPNGFSLDVGVDAWDFRPVSFEEIADVFEARQNPFTD